MNKSRLGGQLQEYCYLAIIMPVIFKNCPKKEQGEGNADTIEYQGMILDFVRPILFHSCLAAWLQVLVLQLHGRYPRCISREELLPFTPGAAACIWYDFGPSFHSVWGVCREQQTWPLKCSDCSQSHLLGISAKNRERYSPSSSFTSYLTVSSLRSARLGHDFRAFIHRSWRL